MKYLEKFDNYPYKEMMYVKTTQKYCVDEQSTGIWIWDNKFKVIKNDMIEVWTDPMDKAIEKFLLESWSGFTIWLTSDNIDRLMTDKEIKKFELKKNAGQYNL